MSKSLRCENKKALKSKKIKLSSQEYYEGVTVNKYSIIIAMILALSIQSFAWGTDAVNGSCSVQCYVTGVPAAVAFVHQNTILYSNARSYMQVDVETNDPLNPFVLKHYEEYTENSNYADMKMLLGVASMAKASNKNVTIIYTDIINGAGNVVHFIRSIAIVD